MRRAILPLLLGLGVAAPALAANDHAPVAPTRSAPAAGPIEVTPVAAPTATVVAAPSPTLTAPATAAPPVAVERITLDQAIARALQRNPSAQAAALELDRADALVRQARAASLPMLNANANYTRLDHDRSLAGRTFAAKDQLNANLQLTVPIIAPGKWAQWSHAKDDARVLGMAGDEVRRQVAISVARTFLTVVSQHRVVEVNERALEAARVHERYAAERLAGGVGRRIDAVRATQQVATNDAAVKRSKVALARSMEALGVLVGEERPIDVAVDPDLGAVPDAAAASAESENRLDLQVARARREAAQQRVRDNWIDFLPQLTGQFQPFYQTPSTLTMPQTGWQAMLMFTMPLYDGGARYGAHDERKILRDQAELTIANLMRQARSEVRIAFEAQRGAEAELDAARAAAQAAHDAEQMAQLAYQAGASTNLEVVDAERQARDADTAVAVAEDSLRQARLDLLIASGRFPAKK